jgi:GMP synthase-like glutamine amidotransferase
LGNASDKRVLVWSMTGHGPRTWTMQRQGEVLAFARDMTNPLIIIQNDPEVPAGVFADYLQAWQVPFRILRADLGDLPPVAPPGVVVLGGTMGVHDEGRYPFLRSLKECLQRWLANGTPLLGVCLGGQLLAEAAGGTVSSNCCGEQGLVAISLTAAGGADPLFVGISEEFRAFQWHNDSFTIPPGATHLARSAVCAGQAFRTGNAWGIQFHPEVDGTIVATWCKDDRRATPLLAEFAAAEADHRQQARQLLANFLAITVRMAGE